MAYARFTPECDLYVFEHHEGGYVCSGCRIMYKPESTKLNAKKMLEHIGEHYRRGDKVPMKLLSVFGILSDGLPVPHVDPVVVEMIAMARREGGKVASWDADVPDDLRMDMDSILDHILDPKEKGIITKAVAAEIAPWRGSMDNA
jgi:hypothetical protein